MAHIVTITGSPWSGKTITARSIWEYLATQKQTYQVIHTDETYMEFIKKYYDYMYWTDLHRSLQHHYENVIDKIKTEYYSYLLDKIQRNIDVDVVIIEWRHLEHILYKLMKHFMKLYKITNVFMDKTEWCLIMNWLKHERNMDLYKHILAL